jgi:single-strand DNA-binding protein
MTTTTITIRGRAGADAEGGVAASGTALARVRVAVTERFRAADGVWKDGNTSWYSVSCFNELARNVLAGIKIGDPVFAHGTLIVEDWTRDSDGVRFVTPTLKAITMGHDMCLGLSHFARRPRQDEATAENQNQGVGNEPRPGNVDADGVLHDDVGDTSAAVSNGGGFFSAPPPPPVGTPSSSDMNPGETGVDDVTEADLTSESAHSAASAA